METVSFDRKLNDIRGGAGSARPQPSKAPGGGEGGGALMYMSTSIYAAQKNEFYYDCDR